MGAPPRAVPHGRIVVSSGRRGCYEPGTMNRIPNDDTPRPGLLGVGLDGAGLGPDSADGQTRITNGDGYVLVGGSEPLHEAMQDVAETIADACRSEGTTIDSAPQELLREIVEDIARDDDESP